MTNPGDASKLEPKLERALSSGLRTEALSAEALARVRRSTEQEWRSRTRIAPRRRWMRLAVAASVASLALSIVWAVRATDRSSAAAAIVGTIVRADEPGVVRRRHFLPDEVLPVGAPVRLGQSLMSDGASVVELTTGGALRIARGSAVRIEAAQRVAVDRGEVYQDVPSPLHALSGVVLATAAGEFQHVGTQFSVAAYGDTTRLRVREGRVRWQSGEGVQVADAGTELVIRPSRSVERRAINTTGGDWTWAEALAPMFVIENRPLPEFLTWVGRETGRKVVFVDPTARRRAAATILHGDVRGMGVLEALSTVMQTTSLRYELLRGEIRVSSSGASRPVSK